MSHSTLRKLAILSLVFLATTASAETATFALLLGPAIRSEDGTALGFELKGGHRFFPNLATNLYYWRVSGGSSLSDAGTTVSASNALSSYGVEALYAFPASNWSAGAKLGLAKNSKDGSASANSTHITLSDSKSSVAVSPTLVYEIPVSFMVVGAEAAYFYSVSSSVPKALSIMAEGRVRF